jgi:hypothetical protein
MDKIETRIVKPTTRQKDGIHTKAFTIGLINVNNESIVIEYNVRRSENRSGCSKIKTDLVELFWLLKLDEITLKLMREVQQRLWWCQVDTLKSMKRKSDF